MCATVASTDATFGIPRCAKANVSADTRKRGKRELAVTFFSSWDACKIRQSGELGFRAARSKGQSEEALHKGSEAGAVMRAAVQKADV